jgi:FAD/FMN-containing dehydrogenase
VSEPSRSSAASAAPRPPAARTLERSFERVEAWGMAHGSTARVLRPRSVEELRAAFAQARAGSVPLALRGTGNSYGDASCSARGWVLDLSRLSRILGFDAATGLAEVEPGVTIEDLWKHALPLGWWPKVVSGTMFPTLGGALAMNIHGKNDYAVGTIGDAVREFDLLLPTGELVTCSREREAELFHAAIGAFGMLGAFTRIALANQRVHSGDLEVRAIATRDLAEMMERMQAERARSDYLVGWIDAFARGEALGRGLLHAARYLQPGEDPQPAETLALGHQELPEHILFVFPKSRVWRILRLFNHDPGMRAINAFKYWSGRLTGDGAPFRQSHAAFAFLLDYVPNWKWAYGRASGQGLIQHQLFLPHETARAALTEALQRCQAARIVPYLAVFKRHRPDPFLLTHGLDGWSLALDFKVTPAGRERLWRHCSELTELALAHGGRFYFAKDLVLEPGQARRMFAPERLDAFLALKRRLDPDGLLETDLWRRLFAAEPSPSSS